ncbi:hypothetical protein WM40_09540 [Robbsia andropogonis]|uniref:Uncharacterized protein n=1 Tax=Robbsia andropogonis TaxID=28092 RepID=A0A0F5K180_9BURK|nr:hypothetical protein [Robbsia andropogonis]KKB63881.1 hypothetical protein WM40_09540 [Robbsia andropogonis]MCP1116681.1 hypothetical protein [Robbsia andropogonis]MCP1126640.1 hypothetical protein [Robbsia andropogonis]
MRKFISPKLVSYGVAALIAAGAAVPVFAQSNTDGTTNSDVTAKSTTGSSLTGSSSPGKGHHTKHTKKSAAMSDSSNTGTGMSQPATGSNMGDMHNMKTNSSNGG